jgi:hypothetical protein
LHFTARLRISALHRDEPRGRLLATTAPPLDGLALFRDHSIRFAGSRHTPKADENDLRFEMREGKRM